jgi:hypothetical protein
LASRWRRWATSPRSITCWWRSAARRISTGPTCRWRQAIIRPASWCGWRRSPKRRDHFIYLERPLEAPVPESRDYRRREPLKRTPTPGDLTPSTPDYETIGNFYAEIRETLVAFAGAIGPAAFLDTADRHIALPLSSVPGLIAIRALPDALRALDMIIEQGEGSTAETSDCHFARFRAMRQEWSALEACNPQFAPAHPAAHDPVMRRPSDKLERVWVTSPPAARLLDLGNALYGHTLVLLQQAYAMESPVAHRGAAVAAAMTLMRALPEIGHALAQMPADEGRDGNAGLSFAVPRNLRSAPPGMAPRLSLERLGELRTGAQHLGLERVRSAIDEAAQQLASDKP